MADDIEGKTMFTIRSKFAFVYFNENKKYLETYDTRTIVYEFESGPEHADSGAAHDEDATPPPPEVEEEPFLRVTKDDVPKLSSEGFLFGRDITICDIVIDKSRDAGVSRKHFALQPVQHGDNFCLAMTESTFCTSGCRANHLCRQEPFEVNWGRFQHNMQACRERYRTSLDDPDYK
ncbi:hypothetical protein F4808DRAFT_444597 [Astrocystis sublimbata]|nr:hypothetical protein F4808DRAFT_444597 [Astrocystis sublimbata]